MFPRSLNIVCTSDGFVGKNLLMRLIGCIPTNKFVNDVSLIRKMKYTLTKLKSNILMYPEASYSFDGTATVLPESLFKCIKFLGVPVVMIKTYGAFSRNPLYNNLQVRKKVPISADVTYLLSKDDIERIRKLYISVLERYRELNNISNYEYYNTINIIADFLDKIGEVDGAVKLREII